MKFGFIAKHRGIWPAGWVCEALGVSRGGFYAWLMRLRSVRSRSDEELGAEPRERLGIRCRTSSPRPRSPGATTNRVVGLRSSSFSRSYIAPFYFR